MVEDVAGEIDVATTDVAINVAVTIITTNKDNGNNDNKYNNWQINRTSTKMNFLFSVNRPCFATLFEG